MAFSRTADYVWALELIAPAGRVQQRLTEEASFDIPGSLPAQGLVTKASFSTAYQSQGRCFTQGEADECLRP